MMDRAKLPANNVLYVPYVMPISCIVVARVCSNDYVSAYIVDENGWDRYKKNGTNNLEPITGIKNRLDNLLTAYFAFGTRWYLIIENTSMNIVEVQYEVTTLAY